MKISQHKPTTFSSLRGRAAITLLSAIFLIAVGCGLLIAGFVVPPPGEIHNSVLVAFGEILTFAGAVFGMKYHYQYNSKNKSHETDETND